MDVAFAHNNRNRINVLGGNQMNCPTCKSDRAYKFKRKYREREDTVIYCPHCGFKKTILDSAKNGHQNNIFN
jgi:DNA-directed RNA polymerase subunit M/transcription elongation factor TFIIS